MTREEELFLSEMCAEEEKNFDLDKFFADCEEQGLTE